MDRIDALIEAADALDAIGKRELANSLDALLKQAKVDENILIKVADTLDALGKRDLANALDAITKKAVKQPKPHHKVGDKVFLAQETPFPVTTVKIDPRVGPIYFLSMWVLERDLREPESKSTDENVPNSEETKTLE